MGFTCDQDMHFLARQVSTTMESAHLLVKLVLWADGLKRVPVRASFVRVVRSVLVGRHVQIALQGTSHRRMTASAHYALEVNIQMAKAQPPAKHALLGFMRMKVVMPVQNAKQVNLHLMDHHVHYALLVNFIVMGHPILYVYHVQLDGIQIIYSTRIEQIAHIV